MTDLHAARLRAEVEHLTRELGELLLFIPSTRQPVLFAQWREQRAAAGSTDTPAWAKWDINADTPMPSGAAFLDLSPAAKRLTGWRHAGGQPGISHQCGTCGFGVHWSTRGRWVHVTPPADGHDPVGPRRAPGGPVSSGQTVTIGPAEPPPLPKRVKGTHGPTPEATR